MTMMVSRSSRGTLEKKLRVSNSSMRRSIPVSVVAPGRAVDREVLKEAIRSRVSSTDHSLSPSLSMKMYQVELTRVPG